MINFPEVPEDILSRLDIFTWENNYKEDRSKDTTFEENNKNTYILILQHCTP